MVDETGISSKKLKPIKLLVLEGIIRLRHEYKKL
jgi:hypothetical protein